MKWALFVIRSGFEPETYCLEGSCSIQLSYRTMTLKTPLKDVIKIIKKGG